MLKVEKASTIILAKYSNYTDIFSLELAAEFPEYTSINNQIIELEEDKQPSCDPIYSLGPINLEMLKAYIEINLANGFIKPFKLPVKAPIFFDCKPNKSLRLYIDYCGFNNLTIKNQYLLLLIGKLLNYLG